MRHRVKNEPNRSFPGLYPLFLRLTMALYLLLLRVLPAPGGHEENQENKKYNILVTGTFYSDNWLKTHLGPLALAGNCAAVRMVASSPVPDMKNVEAIYPHRYLSGIFGGVAARLLTFAWTALRTRPDYIVGFHILVNGLAAALLARLLGARSIYICGGGQREVAGGGYQTENRIFGRLRGPDPVLERQLVAAASCFDIIVTMGSSAARFFRDRGFKGTLHIIPGGFDHALFFPGDRQAIYDLIFIARLSRVKRADIFLKAVALLKKDHPAISAVILGDGPATTELKALSGSLGLQDNVTFLGWQSDTGAWLRKARLFVLTSESEGLSQAMIQAMLCGLPVVVSNVGDLSDLVRHGHNGFLVDRLAPDEFAARIDSLLSRPDMLRSFGEAAHEDASRHETRNVSMLWENVIAARPLSQAAGNPEHG